MTLKSFLIYKMDLRLVEAHNDESLNFIKGSISGVG